MQEIKRGFIRDFISSILLTVPVLIVSAGCSSKPPEPAIIPPSITQPSGNQTTSVQERPSPIEEYARSRGISQDIVYRLKQLSDGANERKFVDLLSPLSERKQKEIVESDVLNDGKISTEEMNYAVQITTDSDGDGYSDWFERNKTKTDPLVPNDRYAILVRNFPEEGPGPSGIEEMYDLLTKKLGWKQENIVMTLTKDATYGNFQKAIDQVAAKADKNDIVFISLGGHGNTERGVFFQDYESGMPYTVINKELDKINAKALIVNVSASYSGAAIKYLKDGSSQRIIFTAANEKEPGHLSVLGPFAEALGRDLYRAAVADGKIELPLGWESGGTRLGNQDSYVSLKEAFRLAEIFLHLPLTWPDYPYDEPQLSDPNGIAPTIFFGEYRLLDSEIRDQPDTLSSYP